MYTLNQVHGVGTNSGIKTVLDTWYQNNLTEVSDKIDGNVGFCGDRTSYINSSGSTSGGGTGTTQAYYGAYIRLDTNKAPTFECENDSDLYTTSGSTNGNKALTYPIGLITADEVAYAGGIWNTVNQSYYLYTDSVYWTMTPYWFNATDNWPCVFYVWGGSRLHGSVVNLEWGIRPVINLKADVKISGGNGTSNNPYVI